MAIHSNRVRRWKNIFKPFVPGSDKIHWESRHAETELIVKVQKKKKNTENVCTHSLVANRMLANNSIACEITIIFYLRNNMVYSRSFSKSCTGYIYFTGYV